MDIDMRIIVNRRHSKLELIVCIDLQQTVLLVQLVLEIKA